MEIGLPYFSLNGVSLFSSTPGKTEVKIYVEIPHSNLQFVHNHNIYTAIYEVDLSILFGDEDDGPRAENKIWRTTVEEKDYEKTTKSGLTNVSTQSFELDPGTYTIIAVLTDVETKRKSSTTIRHTVKTIGEGSLDLADLILANEVKVASNGSYQIAPNVQRQVVGSNAPLFVYYEIYPGVRSENLKILARVVNEKGAIIRTFNFDRLPTKPITRHFFKIDLQEFAVGRYVIEMQVTDGFETTLKGVDFRIRIPGLPASVDNIDVAIRQLRYIANTSRLRDMIKAEPRHREEMFRRFWKERDPSPDTETNELMLEYYGRITQANERFGSVRDGWETDRGEVLVRFGMPNEIERHPYEIDSKPYEIWFYYDTQKRYIFVDEMGYGEYRLVSNLWQ